MLVGNIIESFDFIELDKKYGDVFTPELRREIAEAEVISVSGDIHRLNSAALCIKASGGAGSVKEKLVLEFLECLVDYYKGNDRSYDRYLAIAKKGHLGAKRYLLLNCENHDLIGDPVTELKNIIDSNKISNLYKSHLLCELRDDIKSSNLIEYIDDQIKVYGVSDTYSKNKEAISSCWLRLSSSTSIYISRYISQDIRELRKLLVGGYSAFHTNEERCLGYIKTKNNMSFDLSSSGNKDLVLFIGDAHTATCVTVDNVMHLHEIIESLDKIIFKGSEERSKEMVSIALENIYTVIE